MVEIISVKLYRYSCNRTDKTSKEQIIWLLRNKEKNVEMQCMIICFKYLEI